MTITICLTKGYVSTIDDVDAELAQLKWHVRITDGVCYAKRSLNPGNDHLHRKVLERMIGRPLEKHEQADHINGDGLDNRRENLRLATGAQNQQNKSVYRNSSTGIKGVWRVGERWYARVNKNGKQTYIGAFESSDAAHRAYLAAAAANFGEFAPNENRTVRGKANGTI